MTTLLTGGTGKTGFALAKILHANNKPFLIASRSGTAPKPFSDKAVKFDWLDESTFEGLFNTSAIEKVYIVAPVVDNAFQAVKNFIDLAVAKRVARFVLCSASATGKGEGPIGKVHEYLDEIKVDYTVLRPTWFIENFGTGFLNEINQKSNISTATKEGKIPFVSVEDIAQVAYNALVSEKSANMDLFVFGPRLYNFDEALALLSETVGRKISHNKATREEMKAVYELYRIPKNIYDMRLRSQENVAEGKEQSRVGGSNVVTGKCELKNYFEANKSLWVV